jgi:hypothetical protein
VERKRLVNSILANHEAQCESLSLSPSLHLFHLLISSSLHLFHVFHLLISSSPHLLISSSPPPPLLLLLLFYSSPPLLISCPIPSAPLTPPM